MTERVALITGGSKGIGFGIAEALLKEGYKVAITSRSQKNADEAVKKLKSFGEVMGLQADVKDLQSQKSVVVSVLDKWGQLDVLIANAGVGHFSPIDEMSVEHWNDTVDTNLTGVFYSIKASLDALKRSKGYIFTISSLAGTNFFPEASAYNASKFGLTGFTQAVMLDLRKYDIKVSTIMPGSVSSNFNAHEPDSVSDAWKIQPHDIGELLISILNMPSRTLPSKIEIRPSRPA